jgi:diaminohydroxyphosphoribosylaminopyrimidine deaminase/5-amino-6-(5-phosphoribosylamino)uracil reductase
MGEEETVARPRAGRDVSSSFRAPERLRSAMGRGDENHMRRALELARRAPYTNGNPRVGAVVVRDDAVVGEGFHLGSGHPHAETEALRDVDARGATMYVTLEPCNHHGGTPPCAPALVDSGLARVVVAIADPDERVRGSGIDHLVGHGIEVEIGVLEDDARELNAAFIHHRTTGRPLVVLKLALTLDARLAAADGSSRWITGEEARQRVHEARLASDAVLVGAGTVVTDDPSLTVRAVDAAPQPHRVVVDSSGRVSPTARVFASEGTVVLATIASSPHEVQTAWKEAGAEVLVLPESADGVDLTALVANLGGRGWLEVYCEGGAALATSLLRNGLVDRLELHYGPVIVGSGPSLGDLGISTLTAAQRWSVAAVERAGDDVIVSLRRRG